ncbi:hypothetical protein [Kitasatospora sp. NPDC092286]|uniref:hypothetical protein n=1 Tax=Kitasatospora sp. NPDC092286 TaxID=3364087 RepID=UPI003803CCC1
MVVAVLEALRRQRGQSKGTVAGLRRLTVEILDEAHGPGAVAMPAPATFYRLVRALADPRELPGRPARTATVPAAPFTPTNVLRPGEQVMLDTTRLDVMVVFDQGVVGQPELTIALDVATRSILAAVLRPASTKAVDAALLLAEMAVPHPMRPGWPKVLELSHAAVPYERLLALDARLDGAAARPVIVPETVVVDRGKVFVSEAFPGRVRDAGGERAERPAPPAGCQGAGGAHLRLHQHPAVPVRRRLQRHPPRPRRRLPGPLDAPPAAGPARRVDHRRLYRP